MPDATTQLTQMRKMAQGSRTSALRRPFTSASPRAARYDPRHALRWLPAQRRRPAGLYLRTMSVPSQFAALLDRRLEVGFVRPPVNDPAIGTEVLIREPLVAALPRNRRLVSKGRVPLSTLADEPFVLVQRENGARVPWGGAQGLSWGGLCTARSPRSRSSSDRHGYGRGRQRRVASAGKRSKDHRASRGVSVSAPRSTEPPPFASSRKAKRFAHSDLPGCDPVAVYDL
jgi:hypothetical protein